MKNGIIGQKIVTTPATGAEPVIETIWPIEDIVQKPNIVDNRTQEVVG